MAFHHVKNTFFDHIGSSLMSDGFMRTSSAALFRIYLPASTLAMYAVEIVSNCTPKVPEVGDHNVPRRSRTRRE